MSSPLAKESKSSYDKFLIFLHKKVSHDHRIDVLALYMAQLILALRNQDRIPVDASFLDVGCGDMTLSEKIAQKVDGSKWTCVDVHPCDLERQRFDPKWNKYHQFDGINLPFENNQFDVGIVSDVLHHVDEKDRCALLQSIGRVCRYVIVKDHFEYGPYSHLMLAAMDFVGNYGYGVPIPKKYFTSSSFPDLCRQAGLNLLEMTIGMDLYGQLPFVQVFLRKKWHFLSVCAK